MKTEFLCETHVMKSHFCILVTATLRRGRDEDVNNVLKYAQMHGNQYKETKDQAGAQVQVKGSKETLTINSKIESVKLNNVDK